MNGATPCGPSVVIANSVNPSAVPCATGPIRDSAHPDAFAGSLGHVLHADAQRDRSHQERRHERRRPPCREQTLQDRERGPDRCRRIRPRLEEHPPQAHDLERHEPLPDDGERRVVLRRQPGRDALLPPVPADALPDAVDAAPDQEQPPGAVPQPAEQHRDHDVPVGLRLGARASPRAGCTGSRAATGTASCATAARSPAASARCTAGRSSAGTGTRAAARVRSRCRCTR